MKSNSFNDSPINNPDEDHFGFADFAKSIAESLKNIEAPIGVSIGVHGPWGSGKSSVTNLIRHYLKSEVASGSMHIVDFKCWWFRGEEALTLAFLQDLDRALSKSLGEKTKDLIPKIGKRMLQAGPVVGQAINLATGTGIGSLIKGATNFSERFFSDNDDIQKQFDNVSKLLANQNKRILFIIDDIDRLSPSEQIAIFRLVKSVGRLPNITYLLVFDRQLAETAVLEFFPSEGPHFLEKILQASFEIPVPGRDSLNTALRGIIDSICHPNLDEDSALYFFNVFHDVIAPLIRTPRDLARLANTLTVSWPPVCDDVNVSDFVSIETIRLFEPNLYNFIRSNSNKVCGTGETLGRQTDGNDELQEVLDFASENNQKHIKTALMRLFPRFEGIGYSSSTEQDWEAARRVCSSRHFQSYFRMGISEDTLPKSELQNIIRSASDKPNLKSTLLGAIKEIRKNGRSKIPLILDELNINFEDIDPAHYENLFSVLFEIADEIDLTCDEDRSGLVRASNNLRLHWLMRKILLKKCSLDQRSLILENACRNAPLGWLADFSASAWKDHHPRPGREPSAPENCLIQQSCLDTLNTKALTAIRDAAKNGTLIDHRQLLHILFRWRDLLNENYEEISTWLNQHIETETGIHKLSVAFTGESYSQSIGMFGLGDRVAKRSDAAQINGLDSFLDLEKFKARVKEVTASSTLSKEKIDEISKFLNAWEKGEQD